MSDMNKPLQPERLSRSEVEQVLRRAVAIDLNVSDSLSLDHLRAAADEAGISQSALAAAIRELKDTQALATNPDAISDENRNKTSTAQLSSNIASKFRGPLGMIASAVGATTLIVLIVFMWLIPGILQHTGQ